MLICYPHLDCQDNCGLIKIFEDPECVFSIISGSGLPGKRQWLPAEEAATDVVTLAIIAA